MGIKKPIQISKFSNNSPKKDDIQNQVEEKVQRKEEQKEEPNQEI